MNLLREGELASVRDAAGEADLVDITTLLVKRLIESEHVRLGDHGNDRHADRLAQHLDHLGEAAEVATQRMNEAQTAEDGAEVRLLDRVPKAAWPGRFGAGDSPRIPEISSRSPPGLILKAGLDIAVSSVGRTSMELSVTFGYHPAGLKSA